MTIKFSNTAAPLLIAFLFMSLGMSIFYGIFAFNQHLATRAALATEQTILNSTIDSADLTPGQHTITFTAMTASGQIIETSTTINIESLPTTYSRDPK